MNSEQLLKMALNIQEPWTVSDSKFEKKGKHRELHIHIDFKRGSKFSDESGTLCSVHDTQEKTWRHLNFFEHVCYLHCRVPRIKTSDGKVRLVKVPWAREKSSFTLLFESYVMLLIESEMPVKKIGESLKENPHRLWRIFNYWIERAVSADKIKSLKRLGLDETSQKKGHNYITVAVDIDKRRVINVTEGKDKKAVEATKTALEAKGITANKVKHASLDMSPSFISGVRDYFPCEMTP